MTRVIYIDPRDPKSCDVLRVPARSCIRHGSSVLAVDGSHGRPCWPGYGRATPPPKNLGIATRDSDPVTISRVLPYPRASTEYRIQNPHCTAVPDIAFNTDHWLVVLWQVSTTIHAFPERECHVAHGYWLTPVIKSMWHNSACNSCWWTCHGTTV